MPREGTPSTARPGPLRRLIAVGFGLGYAPIAPGTAGSVLGLALVWSLWTIGGWPAVLAGIVAVAAVGTWAAHGTAAWIGEKDPGVVVVDEVAGQMLALLFVTPTLPALAAGFFLFRAFDIFKPFPARRAEALPGGFGIMMDDWIAGAYANLVLHGLIFLFPRGLGAG